MLTSIVGQSSMFASGNDVYDPWIILEFYRELAPATSHFPHQGVSYTKMATHENGTHLNRQS